MVDKEIRDLFAVLTKKIDGIDTKVDTQYAGLNQKIDVLSQKVDTLKDTMESIDAKNATRHIEVLQRLADLENTVKFIDYKNHENEKEIFGIKENLKIVK